MLSGLCIAIDVQHLYRAGHPGDRGAVFTLADGHTYTEASATLIYAAAASAWLRERGAVVFTNDPRDGTLCGPYVIRNAYARVVGAQAYLACHVNAGGGAYSMTEHMTGRPGQGLGERIGHRLMAALSPPLESFRQRALGPGERGAVCIRAVPVGCAAVICEPFFGDHASHQPMMTPPALWRLGETIAAGVADWWQIQAPTADPPPPIA